MKKNKNRESLAAYSINRHQCQSKDKKKLKQNIRCKSQNAHRVQEPQPKKMICKTHRYQNSQLYHTLQSDKNQKIQDCYKRIIDQMNLQDNKVNYSQFVSIVTKIKKYMNKRVNLSQQSLHKAWKYISKSQNKISQKQLSFSLLNNMSNLFTSSQQLHKPRIKMIKPKPVKIKKQSSNITLQKRQSKPKKSCKSFISQKQNIEPNRFYSLKPIPPPKQIQVVPQLQVIVKIQQGIIERLVVYPDTCLTTLARQFGAKYKLPNCKVVMLRDMIESQLKRHLTQITQESADHYTSDRSGLFSTLNYDEV